MSDKSRIEPKDSHKEGWKLVLDSDRIDRAVTRISHEILERNGGASKVAIVGIRTRGEYLARRISETIKHIESADTPLGVLDITLYRDDLSHSNEQPLVLATELPFNVDKYNIILVDDVLYTGRTIRSALDAIIDFGRPISVQLAVLVDRGHRELPIRADYIGKSIPSARKEIVEVCMTEKDGEDGVYLRS